MTDELKKAFETFIISLNSILEKIETDLSEREAKVAKRTTEVKLIDDRLKQLAEDKQALVYDRDMLEKERLVLKDKKESPASKAIPMPEATSGS